MEYTKRVAGEYTVFVSDEVLDQDAVSLDKTLETIGGYGFRGYSTGGKNGVFLIRKGKDSPLEATLDGFEASAAGAEFQERFGVAFGELRRIKLVTHRDDDTRAVGYYCGDYTEPTEHNADAGEPNTAPPETPGKTVMLVKLAKYRKRR
ncbi:MAG: hypothetical protein ABIE94_06730 [archaeon]